MVFLRQGSGVNII